MWLDLLIGLARDLTTDYTDFTDKKRDAKGDLNRKRSESDVFIRAIRAIRGSEI